MKTLYVVTVILLLLCSCANAELPPIVIELDEPIEQPSVVVIHVTGLRLDFDGKNGQLPIEYGTYQDINENGQYDEGEPFYKIKEDMYEITDPVIYEALVAPFRESFIAICGSLMNPEEE